MSMIGALLLCHGWVTRNLHKDDRLIGILGAEIFPKKPVMGKMLEVQASVRYELGIDAFRLSMLSILVHRPLLIDDNRGKFVSEQRLDPKGWFREESSFIRKRSTAKALERGDVSTHSAPSWRNLRDENSCSPCHRRKYA